MEDCIFCKIVKEEIPSSIEAETENLVAFRDINPRAPTHLLIVPKKHLEDIREDNGVIWAAIGKLAVKLAEEKGLQGFRIVHNAGKAAAVSHMHVHLLGEITAEREI